MKTLCVYEGSMCTLLRGQTESHDVCNALQQTATHCNTLQHTATHCKTESHDVCEMKHHLNLRITFRERNFCVLSGGC